MRVVVKQTKDGELELCGQRFEDCSHTERGIATAREENTGKTVPQSLATQVSEHCILLHHQDEPCSQRFKLYLFHTSWDLKQGWVQ